MESGLKPPEHGPGASAGRPPVPVVSQEAKREPMAGAIPEKDMPEEDYLALRAELLRAATQMSGIQTLELADLLHTVIRLRKPSRGLKNLDDLLMGEVRSFDAALAS